MTNEKLCTLIQQGQKEYLADLWEQTRRFGAMQARRYFVSLGNLGGVELEDLLQCRWIALLQAVRYFRAEKGCFLTFYGYTLKNAFREAAGLRSSKRDPLCDSLSLDAPAAEEEGGTLLDFVADPIDPLQPLEDDVYQQQLHAALERALSLLSPEREKHIRQRYYQGMSFRQIARQEGVGWETIRQQEEDSLQKLRCGPCAPLLRGFRYWDTEFNPYSGTGLTAWRSGAGSRPEKFAEHSMKNKGSVK